MRFLPVRRRGRQSGVLAAGELNSQHLEQRRRDRGQPLLSVGRRVGRRRQPLRRRRKQQSRARVQYSALHPHHRPSGLLGMAAALLPGSATTARAQARTACATPQGLPWTLAATSTSPTKATAACLNTRARLRPTPPPIWCSGSPTLSQVPATTAG